jgi:hypothetical protein
VGFILLMKLISRDYQRVWTNSVCRIEALQLSKKQSMSNAIIVSFRANLFSEVLGLGYRCGFLGMLHMDVFQQRLKQEYGTAVITTAPSVTYRGIFLFHFGFFSCFFVFFILNCLLTLSANAAE